MRRKQIVKRLRHFREEFDKDGIEILDCPVPVALILFDVCDALGLGLADRAQVLGPERLAAVEQWKEIVVYLVPAERVRAVKAAAVPGHPLALEGGITC